MSATKENLMKLLAQGCKLSNLTRKSSGEVAVWHLVVDRALEGTKYEDVKERYDDPDRSKHRQFVERLFEEPTLRRHPLNPLRASVSSKNRFTAEDDLKWARRAHR